MTTSKISRRCVFICLLALTSVTGYLTPISNSECICPLGMEDGRIKDQQITTSSVYKQTTVHGGQARLRQNIPPWAGWCPDISGGKINERNYDQYIEIDLLKLTKITGIATQGRGLNATVSGVKDYKIQYRKDGGKWYFYQGQNQTDKVFRGNTNVSTGTIVRHDLDLAIMARYIRVYPGYRNGYAVCMRLEIYGSCVDKEVILSYSMPVGQTTKNGKVHYKDTSYNGVTTPDFYKNGTGILTDGKFGPDEAKSSKGEGWVGWNVTKFKYIDITFEFSCVRKFINVTLTVNDDRRKEYKNRDHAVFNRTQIFFASSKDGFSDTSFLQYCPKNYQAQDTPYNANVTLSLCENTARFIKLRLYLGGKWLLITEVSFNSVAASENEKHSFQYCLNSGHTSCASTKPADDSTNSTALFVGIAIALAIVLIVFFVILIIYKKRRQASKLSTAVDTVGIENQAVQTEKESSPNNNQGLDHVNPAPNEEVENSSPLSRHLMPNTNRPDRSETTNSDHSSGYVIPIHVPNSRIAPYAEFFFSSPSVCDKLNRNRLAAPYKIVDLDQLNISRAEGGETINSDRSSGYEVPVPCLPIAEQHET